MPFFSPGGVYSVEEKNDYTCDGKTLICYYLPYWQRGH